MAHVDFVLFVVLEQFRVDVGKARVADGLRDQPTDHLATRLRAKAYVLDVRYEKAFETDVTARVKKGFAATKIGAPHISYLAGEGNEQRGLSRPAPVLGQEPA